MNSRSCISNDNKKVITCQYNCKRNMVAGVHYNGTLPDSGEVFDSGEERPDFLGRSQTNDSWVEEEIMGAKKGDTSEFTLSPKRLWWQGKATLEIPRAQFEHWNNKPRSRNAVGGKCHAGLLLSLSKNCQAIQ